jgi:hypothetical protein
MITAQTARLIAMQINKRRLEEVRASWFFLLIPTISDSATYYSFRQGMESQLSNLSENASDVPPLNLTKVNQS